MKKNFNEISGMLLTENQMKSLKGGTIVGGTNTCDGSVCPINRTWNCVEAKVGGCTCKGVATQGGELQSDTCEKPKAVTPRDSL